uniref:Uncharacterized protein LOC101510325 n=1 Tax=Cicer arietinum TaxID=3827 RepID=A0A1S2XKV3_CICAR|nr:uncharacterized protein LOC101510325 [Cicer arietinum]
MASNFSFLNSLTQSKKPNIKDSINNEELSLVKAAAWAWYQHGSGSCHDHQEASSEFHVTRIHRTPRPSRYKLELEAIQSMEKEVIKEEYSLLDAYEVQSISSHLNRLLESNNNNNHNYKKIVNSMSNNIAIKSVDDGIQRTKKKKIRKGFFLKHGAMCGREGDVVDPISVSKNIKPSIQGFKHYTT